MINFTFLGKRMYFEITSQYGRVECYRTNSGGEGLWMLRQHGWDRNYGEGPEWIPHYEYDQILGAGQFSVAGKSQAAAKAYVRRRFKEV